LSALEELNIQIVKITDDEAWAFCPGHESRTGQKNNRPNKFSVNMESGRFSCFSCGFSGPFVYLVQEVTGYDRHDAEHWIRSRGGVARLRRVLGNSEGRSSHLERDAGIQPWNEARLALFTSPPNSALDERGISQGAVEHYGVLWDADKQNWILPIRSPETGELWGFQEKGQGWFCNKPGGVPKAQTLFGLTSLQETTAILVESPLDCLRIYSAGISGSVSSYGVQVSDKQLDLLFDRADTVVFALDNDAAGLSKMRALRVRYLNSGRKIKFLDYSHISWAKDLGTTGVSDTDIHRAVLNAKNIFKYRP
jgi:DNA primase